MVPGKHNLHSPFDPCPAMHANTLSKQARLSKSSQGCYNEILLELALDVYNIAALTQKGKEKSNLTILFYMKLTIQEQAL
jgi:hypothetical protein